MPDNEIMMWITQVTSWLSWYEYVHESVGYYDADCPDFVKDDPSLFTNWLNQQREKSKSSTPYKGK